MNSGIKRLALVMMLTGAAGTGAMLWLDRPFAAEAERPPQAGDMRQFNLLSAPRPAPEVSFTDAAGREISLGDFRGKLVLVNLWATWCGPCVEEMPSLDRLQARLGGRDFTILAVSSDRAGAKVVEPFVRKLGLADLKVYLDPKSTVNRAFGVRGLPTSILIDAEGRELGRLEGGAKWDSPETIAFLKHFIAKSAPPQDPLVKTSG
jgi:thiol-disulfide isomerase/thioredoxin